MTEPKHVTKAREMQAAMNKAAQPKAIKTSTVKAVEVPSGDTAAAIDLSPINAKLKSQDQMMDQMEVEIRLLAEKQFAQDAKNVEIADDLAQLGYQDAQLLEHINHAKTMVGQFNASSTQSLNRVNGRVDSLQKGTNEELQKIHAGMKAINDKATATQTLSWNLACGSVGVSLFLMIVIGSILPMLNSPKAPTAPAPKAQIQKVQ